MAPPGEELGGVEKGWAQEKGMGLRTPGSLSGMQFVMISGHPTIQKCVDMPTHPEWNRYVGMCGQPFDLNAPRGEAST